MFVIAEFDCIYDAGFEKNWEVKMVKFFKNGENRQRL